MRNFKRISAALLLAFSLLVAAIPFVSPVSAATLVYSKESNSGTRDVVCVTLEGTGAGSYYTGNYTYDKLDDLSGNALFAELQELMRNTHTTISKYDDCHYKADKVDCEENNGKVTLIYTSYQATMEQWNGWNREHVWPQSLGPGSNTSAGTKNGGADMHHVRPVDKGVNSSRGNKPYGNSNNGKAKYGSDPAVGVLGGTYNSTYYEPNDNVKGDVARICLYMYVRWNTDWGCDSLEEVFESIEVLLEWCALDPVDTWEMGRNEVVGAIQGNRNVFIDYPELAWLMLGYDIPEGMSTPSGKASSGDSPCPHTATELRNKSDATCGKDGYSGDVHCKACGSKISSGTVIKANGNHKFGDWETKGDKQIRVCSVCQKSEERAIPECGHASTELINALDPTCGKDGYSGDTACKDCGAVISAGSPIPKTNDHKNTERRGAAAPTCKTDGSEGDLYCTDCGCMISLGAIIPATGEHVIVEGEVISEPTKDKDGLRMDKCANCDYVEGVVLHKTGGDNVAVIIIIAVAAGVVLGAAVAAVIVVKKKKVR